MVLIEPHAKRVIESHLQMDVETHLYLRQSIALFGVDTLGSFGLHRHSQCSVDRLSYRVSREPSFTGRSFRQASPTAIEP